MNWALVAYCLIVFFPHSPSSCLTTPSPKRKICTESKQYLPLKKSSPYATNILEHGSVLCVSARLVFIWVLTYGEIQTYSKHKQIRTRLALVKAVHSSQNFLRLLAWAMTMGYHYIALVWPKV